MKISRRWLEKINGFPEQKFVRVDEDFYVSDEVNEVNKMGLHKEIVNNNNLMEKVEVMNDLDAGYILRIRDRIFISGESESLGLPRLFNKSEMRQRSANLLRRDFSDFVVVEQD